jgi:hypothetical protein
VPKVVLDPEKPDSVVSFSVFNFNDDNRISEIQKDGNYQWIAEKFARTAKEIFEEKITLYYGAQPSKETVIEFLSESH